jgi:hypothetical protein
MIQVYNSCALRSAASKLALLPRNNRHNYEMRPPLCALGLFHLFYTFTQCNPIYPNPSSIPLNRRADPNLTGYLGAFFLGNDPYVYLYLSNGNTPTQFTALNKGQPVIKPTAGTGGVRDPAIVVGGGSEAGKKWYIVGTDLNIGKTTWDAAQRKGSRGIYVWESTDLVNWNNERLVIVEGATAGMVWAPEALWDADKGMYLVHWASKFYSSADSGHTGTPGATMIRYAHTADFKTFTTPQTYIDHSPYSTIDLTVLPVLANSSSNGITHLRFAKNESNPSVYLETSSNGLAGPWSRPGGPSAVITTGVEGPAAYWDNTIANKAHVLLDFYNSDGYRPYEQSGPNWSNTWTTSSRTGFPTGLRHGSVLPITSSQYNALKLKWA